MPTVIVYIKNICLFLQIKLLELGQVLFSYGLEPLSKKIYLELYALRRFFVFALISKALLT